jgi:alpha-galactosidase
VTDADVRAAADEMVSSGMRDAGYVYVNLDDTWEGERDAQGVLHTNKKFPDMKAMVDYVHSKGLKFGIYSSPGPKTCGGYAGSFGHEEQDAKMYAAWGVDFLKYDLCSMQDDMRSVRDSHPEDPMAEYKFMIAAYRKMGDALKATGRPIVYSLCQYGMDEPWKFGPALGATMWRTTDDINDTYQRMLNIAYAQVGLGKYTSPGHWNDPDMLEVGNGGMNDTEYRAHFSLWAIFAAPLIAGNDLRDMRPEIHDILTNKEVIAVDQDALGREGERVWKNGDLEVWAKQLKDGSRAVVLLNRGGTERNISANWENLGYPNHLSASVRDLWQHKDLGKFTGRFSAAVASHGVVMVTVKP